MKYHLRLIKGLSYCGVVSATRKQPDVYVEDKAIADAAVASGYFELIGDEELALPETEHLDNAQLEEMKIDDLRKLAADMGIDTKGFKKKADFVEAIAAVEVTIGNEGENKANYGEEDPEQ